MTSCSKHSELSLSEDCIEWLKTEGCILSCYLFTAELPESDACENLGSGSPGGFAFMAGKHMYKSIVSIKKAEPYMKNVHVKPKISKSVEPANGPKIRPTPKDASSMPSRLSFYSGYLFVIIA